MRKQKQILLPFIDSDVVIKEIGDFIVSQVLDLNKTGGVIGLSGGVDSTLTATIAKLAFDNYNATLSSSDQKMELIGYILPSSTNNEKDKQTAVSVAEKIGIRYEIHDITGIVDAYALTNKEAIDIPFHKGNLTSEMRAVVLHGKAATENKVLIGTGNKDEDFGIGYYTLFGDGAVHISPIANLSKRLVNLLAIKLGFAEITQLEPTAGLETGQTDFKDLGYHYGIVELVQEGLKQGLNYDDILESDQLSDLVLKEIISYVKIFHEEKFSSIQDMLKDILRRHDMALKKAKLVSPEKPEITLNYAQ